MTQPEYATALQAAYGAPSQAAFGSAVFYEQTTSDDLEQTALAKYRTFVGKLWEQYGEAAWLDPWKRVYERQPNTKADGGADIVAELRGIKDQTTRLSVPMILDNIEGAEQARAALAVTFDDPAVTDLLVYNTGDSGALSGLLIAGCRAATHEATFLVFLMD